MLNSKIILIIPLYILKRSKNNNVSYKIQNPRKGEIEKATGLILSKWKKKNIYIYIYRFNDLILSLKSHLPT